MHTYIYLYAYKKMIETQNIENNTQHNTILPPPHHFPLLHLLNGKRPFLCSSTTGQAPSSSILRPSLNLRPSPLQFNPNFSSFLHRRPRLRNFGSRPGKFGVCAIERCGMLQGLMNLLSLCFRPFARGSKVDSNSVSREGKDGLLWFRDFGKYGSGDFSIAVMQANQVIEDQSQIESGSFGTFVGVYDGHGGPEASRYVCDHLFPHFKAISAEARGNVSSETIQRAFRATEEGFTSVVSNLWTTYPQIATAGSCCLVGVICQQTLFVANLGDSRVVLGKKVGNTGGVAAIQLSTEHNANLEAIRQELKESHPNDPEIVVLKHGVWRVKGIIQVSRSIGDVYMKHAQFNREPINAKFRLPQPITNMPILSANPTIIAHPLQPSDSFLIFASDGLWEHLSNERAVEIVQSHPRAGIAKRLVKAALQEAAKKREMRYSDLKKIDKKVRRHFHDDITVIVLFLNHDLISRCSVQDPPVSIRSTQQN